MPASPRCFDRIEIRGRRTRRPMAPGPLGPANGVAVERFVMAGKFSASERGAGASAGGAGLPRATRPDLGARRRMPDPAGLENREPWHHWPTCPGRWPRSVARWRAGGRAVTAGCISGGRSGARPMLCWPAASSWGIERCPMAPIRSRLPPCAARLPAGRWRRTLSSFLPRPLVAAGVAAAPRRGRAGGGGGDTLHPVLLGRIVLWEGDRGEAVASS